jgi:hypothetical protein
MINYDPLQTQSSYAAYSGAMNPFGSPYTPTQTSIHPFPFNPVTFNPQGVQAQAGIGSPFGQQNPFVQQGYAGVPNYGAIAQQQQHLQQLASLLASQLASQGLAHQGMIPQQQFGWPAQMVPLQNQILAQNPIAAAILQNPVLAQQLALQAVAQQSQPQIGQYQSGQNWPAYQQPGSVFGGQPGVQTGMSFGQIPYAQTGIQSGYPLAPQSWVGQVGLSQPGGRGLY